MRENLKPIGVLDSGVGGFSVVAKMKEILPCEDIIYFGDSKNCPYGAKNKEEVLYLTQKASDYLVDKGVKAIVMACNTISTEKERIKCKLPVSEIISPICRNFDKSICNIGIIGTPLTIKSGIYEKLLKENNPRVTLTGAYSETLALSIEKGDFSSEELLGEFKKAVEKASSNGAKDIILACTHYPLALESLKKIYPHITFHDPAYYQCLELKETLGRTGLLNDENKEGSFTFAASGESDSASYLINKIGIKNIKEIESHVSIL